jgi:hypothetical protein
VVDVDSPGVLQVYPVGVGTVLGGRDGQVVDHDALAAVELEVALRAVHDRDPSYRDIGAAIEPQRLQSCFFYFTSNHGDACMCQQSSAAMHAYRGLSLW